MHRRSFLHFPALAAVAAENPLPEYRVESPFQPEGKPNRYPGQVISAPVTATAESVAASLAASMKALTGLKDAREAWRGFFEPKDVVGIKVNCSGSPQIMSHPLIVAEVARQLIAVGVAPSNVYLYERFDNQMVDSNYAAVLPAGVQQFAMETGEHRRANFKNYDPRVFVETDFFGEEQTRSFLSRLVTEKLTKIVNVPNMKDHGASGVTGCLKNAAYGSFSNVARSHRDTKTNTLSFIGTLYATEPLRSKLVLNVMDGIKGVWQGGPFVRKPEYIFEPRRMMVGTDPVSMDRLLIDIIEAKRKEMGAPSVWDRTETARQANRLGSPFIREPGHIEFAGKLSLGVYDKNKIQLQEITV